MVVDLRTHYLKRLAGELGAGYTCELRREPGQTPRLTVIPLTADIDPMTVTVERDADGDFTYYEASPRPLGDITAPDEAAKTVAAALIP